MNKDKYIIEYGGDHRNLSLRENKGYLIYEVGILGGDDKVGYLIYEVGILGGDDKV